MNNKEKLSEICKSFACSQGGCKIYIGSVICSFAEKVPKLIVVPHRSPQPQQWDLVRQPLAASTPTRAAESLDYAILDCENDMEYLQDSLEESETHADLTTMEAEATLWNLDTTARIKVIINYFLTLF